MLYATLLTFELSYEVRIIPCNHEPSELIYFEIVIAFPFPKQELLYIFCAAHNHLILIPSNIAPTNNPAGKYIYQNST